MQIARPKKTPALQAIPSEARILVVVIRPQSLHLAVYGSIPCDTKFLREFIFADWRRELIFAIGTDCFFLAGN